MTGHSQRTFKLGVSSAGPLPFVDETGAYLGAGVGLLERDSAGRWRPRSREVLEALFQAVYGAGAEVESRMAGLSVVAKALDAGDLGRAEIALLRLRLPPLAGDAALERLAKVDRWLKYDADQPRASAGQPNGGQWISDDGGPGAAASLQTAAVRIDPTVAKKQKFVSDHLVEMQKAAQQLGVPVENLLGISALESNWGQSRFATDGHNLFEMYYPAPLAIGSMPAKKFSNQGGRKPSRALLARFANSQDCIQSFVSKYRNILRERSSPESFATALQDEAKFGVDPDTGKPLPGYVHSVSQTIRSLRALIYHQTA